MEFRWNDWNLEHATCHGVSTGEIEGLVDSARPPYPEKIGDEKFLVVGRGAAGRWIQAIYLVDDDGIIYPIHARPLTEREKTRVRKRIR